MINSLFKYMPLRLEFFDNFLLRASTRDALNDPFECLPTKKLWAKFAYGKKEVTEEELANYNLDSGNIVSDLIFTRHGLISLTETNDNLLMWSHYADQHRGMVIEFDAKHQFFSDKSGDTGYDRRIHRVLYRKERFSGCDEVANFTSLSELFFHKSDEWEYEKEHRLLLSLSKSDVILVPKSYENIDSFPLTPFTDNFDRLTSYESIDCALYFYTIPYDAIKSITFGCNVKEDLINEAKIKIKSNVNLQHVFIKKAIINQQDYKLDFYDADSKN